MGQGRGTKNRVKQTRTTLPRKPETWDHNLNDDNPSEYNSNDYYPLDTIVVFKYNPETWSVAASISDEDRQLLKKMSGTLARITEHSVLSEEYSNGRDRRAYHLEFDDQDHEVFALFHYFTHKDIIPMDFKRFKDADFSLLSNN